MLRQKRGLQIVLVMQCVKMVADPREPTVQAILAAVEAVVVVGGHPPTHYQKILSIIHNSLTHKVAKAVRMDRKTREDTNSKKKRTPERESSSFPQSSVSSCSSRY